MPNALYDLHTLVVLHCDRNRINGSISRRIGLMVRLESIVCDGNQLSGELPAELFYISPLFRVELNNNQLRVSGSCMLPIRSYIKMTMDIDE